MKKTALIISALLIVSSAFAQTASDALLYSQTQYEGTARTLAMGNAFTALGGDIGAVTINPAASGVMRNWQFSFTPEFINSRNNTTYLGNTTTLGRTNFTLSSAGMVMAFNTDNYSGLMNFNIGFTFNRTGSYNSVMAAYGGRTDKSSMLAAIANDLYGTSMFDLDKEDDYDPFYDSNIPWQDILAWQTYGIAPVDVISTTEYIASTENVDDKTRTIAVGGDLDQDFYRRTIGGSSEFAFNFGGNINDAIYFGVNLNILSVDYTINESYTEAAVNPSVFQDGFVSMISDYWQHTTGAGFNAKFGLIANPVGGLRLGATFTTPTWLNLTDEWQSSMKTSFTNGNSYPLDSPTGAYDYKVKSPAKWSIGAAYVIGDLGLVSFDYEGTNYSRLLMTDYNKNTTEFKNENSDIRNYFGVSTTLRAGAEVWLNDIVALRAGYNYYSPASKHTQSYVGGNSKTALSANAFMPVSMISGGLGFRVGRSMTIDVAYQRVMRTAEKFQLYDNYLGLSDFGGVYRKSLNKFNFTLGWNF